MSEGSQWVEERILGMEEFGEMASGTREERWDCVDAVLVKFGVVEFEKIDGAL